MTLYSCLLFWSFLNGVDPNVTQAVIKVESSGNPYAVGQGKDFGLMQIRAKYSRFNKLQLLQSCTNIMEGTRILGELKKECVMCVEKVYVNAYNLGRTGARKLKYPRLWKYHTKVVKEMSK